MNAFMTHYSSSELSIVVERSVATISSLFLFFNAAVEEQKQFLKECQIIYLAPPFTIIETGEQNLTTTPEKWRRNSGYSIGSRMWNKATVLETFLQKLATVFGVTVSTVTFTNKSWRVFNSWTDCLFLKALFFLFMFMSSCIFVSTTAYKSKR